MTKVTTQATVRDLESLIEKSSTERERIVLTRRGKNAVALVPIEDLNFLEDLWDRIDVEEAREILARVKRGEESTIPWATTKKDLGLWGMDLLRRSRHGPAFQSDRFPAAPGRAP